jgi:ubiquinone/menaquinone biosynthesis C-methylase UbiE
VRSPRQNRPKYILRGCNHVAFFSDRSGLPLSPSPDDTAVAFNVRALSPGGDCATQSHRFRIYMSENAVQQTFTRELPAEQFDYLAGTRAVPKAIMSNKSIHMLSDAWQHTIGNVVAAPGTKRRPRSATIRGVATTPSHSITDIRSFFDRCASTGSPERHGQAQRLLEYRLALVRSLARPRLTDVVLDLGCGNGHHLLALAPEVARGIGIDVSPGMIELARTRLKNSTCKANLRFEVDNAEELKEIADQSIDLAICIGAFEHILDKRAMLASIYRVLTFGGRFVCLTLHADYVWYRTIAPVLGFGTKHLSSDRMLTHDEFSSLLDESGFCRIRCAPWTFIPKGDMPALIALLLSVFDIVGRHARVVSFRGGLSLCAWKKANLA